MSTTEAEYACDVCGMKAPQPSVFHYVLPDGWEEVAGYEVCGKCCKIMRAFVNKEV